MNDLDSLKILVVRPDAIGDVTLMIPMLNTIKATLPKSEIYTLQQSYTKPLLDNHPSVKEVILDWKKEGKYKGVQDFWPYVSYIRSLQFDMVIFSYLDDFYAFLMFFAQIPMRIGDGNRLFLRPLLTHPVVQPFRNMLLHETEQNIVLLLALKTTLKRSDKMDIHLKNGVEKEVKELLKKEGWKEEPVIGIHPATGGGNQPWIAKKYGELVALIHKKTNYKVVLTGFGSKEKKVIATILEHSGEKRPLVLFEKTSLEQLKGVIKLSSAYIGADTGPTHVAAALKTPVLCISPTKFVKPLRWGPWQVPHRVIGKPKTCTQICKPGSCGFPNCSDDLSVEDAFTALQKVLKTKDIALESAKEGWFRESVTIGFYVAKKEDIPYLKWLVEQAKKEGLDYHVLCESKGLQAMIEKEQMKSVVKPAWRLVSLLSYIAKHDMNIMHLISPKNRGFWWLIRQLSGLFLYCPTMIIKREEVDKSKELIKEYIEKYKSFF